MSFVKTGAKIPPRHLAAGVPARILRELTDDELAKKVAGTRLYHDLARRSLATLTAVEPLFGCSTEVLFEEWVASGADAVIVTARQEFLDETWLGRPLRRELLAEFTRLGVDPCGERGEYHTVVTNSSLFNAPLRLRRRGHVQRSGCWALDLTVDDAQRA